MNEAPNLLEGRSLAQWVKILVADAGGVAAVATFFGVSDTLIYQWMRGEGKPSSPQLERLARFAENPNLWLALAQATPRKDVEARVDPALKLGKAQKSLSAIRMIANNAYDDLEIEEMEVLGAVALLVCARRRGDPSPANLFRSQINAAFLDEIEAAARAARAEIAP